MKQILFMCMLAGVLGCTDSSVEPLTLEPQVPTLQLNYNVAQCDKMFNYSVFLPEKVAVEIVVGGVKYNHIGSLPVGTYDVKVTRNDTVYQSKLVLSPERAAECRRLMPLSIQPSSEGENHVSVDMLTHSGTVRVMSPQGYDALHGCSIVKRLTFDKTCNDSFRTIILYNEDGQEVSRGRVEIKKRVNYCP